MSNLEQEYLKLGKAISDLGFCPDGGGNFKDPNDMTDWQYSHLELTTPCGDSCPFCRAWVYWHQN